MNIIENYSGYVRKKFRKLAKIIIEKSQMEPLVFKYGVGPTKIFDSSANNLFLAKFPSSAFKRISVSAYQRINETQNLSSGFQKNSFTN